MGSRSRIEWTDATWNPWYGCRKVANSPACTNCYAERDMMRFGRDFDVVTRASRATFEAPLSWKEPRRIFTCSWSDFFIEESDQWREAAWDIIERTRRHTYLILTKRPGRMAWWAKQYGWPQNAWAGVTVETARFLPRLDVLARVPASVRFVSAEPLLEPLDLRPWLTLNGGILGPPVRWVIVGGESGPKARPMHPDCVRGIRDQCQEAGTPFFFKQWGEWSPNVPLHPTGREPTFWFEEIAAEQDGALCMFRVGKKAAGALLDGCAWREMPQVQRAEVLL